MRRSTSLILLLLLALSGCAGEPDVYAVIQDRAYSPSEFKAAAANKAVRTVVAGNPFTQTTPMRVTHNAVLAAMQPVNWWQPLPFTPKAYFTDTPKGQHNPRYHVVVALNPDDAGSDWYDAPCAGKGAPPTLEPSENLTARMYFCRDTAPLSLSHGTLPAPTSSDDKRFRRMITRMTMALFPQRRDDRDCFNARRKGRC